MHSILDESSNKKNTSKGYNAFIVSGISRDTISKKDS